MMTILHIDGLTPLPKLVLSDFSSFYQVGRMALEGRYPNAYDLQIFSQLQMQASGKTSFFPWSYPPPVGLLVAFLPLLPFGVAYAVFTASTYLAFMHVLKKLSISADAYLLSRVVAAPAKAMVTVFASLTLLGVGGTLAIMGQILCAGVALGMTLYSAVKGWEARRMLGFAVLTTLCIWPYAFVYDFPALGVAVALLAEPLDAACGVAKKVALLSLTWLAIGGLLINTLFLHAAAQGWLKLSGFLFLLATALVFDTLRKASQA